MELVCLQRLHRGIRYRFEIRWIAFRSKIKEMAVATHLITAAERARRVRVYEEALASVRLEGFELDEQVKAFTSGTSMDR